MDEHCIAIVIGIPIEPVILVEWTKDDALSALAKGGQRRIASVDSYRIWAPFQDNIVVPIMRWRIAIELDVGVAVVRRLKCSGHSQLSGHGETISHAQFRRRHRPVCNLLRRDAPIRHRARDHRIRHAGNLLPRRHLAVTINRDAQPKGAVTRQYGHRNGLDVTQQHMEQPVFDRHRRVVLTPVIQRGATGVSVVQTELHADAGTVDGVAAAVHQPALVADGGRGVAGQRGCSEQQGTRVAGPQQAAHHQQGEEDVAGGGQEPMNKVAPVALKTWPVEGQLYGMLLEFHLVTSMFDLLVSEWYNFLHHMTWKEKTMSEVTLRALPSSVSRETLTPLLDDVHNREVVLQAMLRRFEQRYGDSLEALEARLARGEGPEHPDWEDSIEWRNAVEALQRTRVMRRLLEWLLSSTVPSPAS